MADFRRALLRWYRRHGRHDLPWRRTHDPYAILVSEVMLQQTQVATVAPYYKRWLRRFPSFQSLAKASESQVLHAWQGLGYYSRARNLHAAAKVICEKFKAECPESVDELRELPGLGRYTANAVATFAFDQALPIVDANIARVFSRLFNISTPVDSSLGRTEIWKWAELLVPRHRPGIFNSALMDLGATVCLPRNPRCGVCPVKSFCRASNPAILPIKRSRPRLKKLCENHSFTLRAKRNRPLSQRRFVVAAPRCRGVRNTATERRGYILLQKCTTRWRGMWMLPPLAAKRDMPIHTSRFPFTNHQITLRVFAVSPNGTKPNQRWFSLRRLTSIPIPSPHRRAINALLAHKVSVV